MADASPRSASSAGLLDVIERIQFVGWNLVTRKVGFNPRVGMQLPDDVGRFILTRGLLVSTALAPPYLLALGGGEGRSLGSLGPLVLASSAAGLLRVGANLLAIQVHNATTNDTDLLLKANEQNLLEILPSVDLLIGAVLLPGAKAPKLIKRCDLPFTVISASSGSRASSTWLSFVCNLVVPAM